MLNIYNYLIDTGTITVDAEDVLTTMQNIMKSTFGSNLNVDPSTPQGMLIQDLTIVGIAVAQNNSTIANQINRNIAGGVYLDSDAAFFGVERIVGSPTTVYATISGKASTLIAANSQAKNSVNGSVFATVEDVTIPESGVISGVKFQSWSNTTNPPDFINGPITCASGTLTQILSTIIGWESVTNPDDAIPGVLQQSDVNLNNSLDSSMAAQSVGSMAAILAQLYLTPGVTSAYPLENVKNEVQVKQGVTMVPHSIYFCIAGTANDSDIANAFTLSKDPGCDYNNGPGINKSYLYTAPISAQEIEILWDSPSIVEIAIDVTISELTTVQEPITAVQNAIIAYAAGEVPLMKGFVVGANVSPNQIAAAITQQVPGIFIQEITVAIAYFTKQGTLENTSNIITNMPSIDRITNGMTVTGNGVPSMTTVTNNALSPNSIQLSNNVTLSGIEILTFGDSVASQATPISINPWEQAATIANYITVEEI